MENFRIIGPLDSVETIAAGAGIRVIRRLPRHYGHGRWHKRKGYAEVQFSTGEILPARFSGQNCTGTRLPGSADVKSRSSGSCRSDET
jgi:hypothetical protein